MGRRHKRRPKCSFGDCHNAPYEQNKWCSEHMEKKLRAHWDRKYRINKQEDITRAPHLYKFRRRGSLARPKEIKK